jgi:hypothetical protein
VQVLEEFAVFGKTLGQPDTILFTEDFKSFISL